VTRFPSLLASTLCVGLLATSPAVAQVEDEQQSERFEDAKRFYDNGKLAYDVGRFADAAQQFERAYALRPAPLLLFNMAQCYRQLGDTKKAVFLYESFLRESPDQETAQIALAREELDKLRAQLAEAEAEAAREAELQAELQARQESRPMSAPDATGSDDDDDDGGDLLLWGAVGGGAVLVAAVTTAAIIGVIAATPAPGDVGRIDFR
jgi:tetratricopeptide (TPR) repeat protein